MAVRSRTRVHDCRDSPWVGKAETNPMGTVRILCGRADRMDSPSVYQYNDSGPFIDRYIVGAQRGADDGRDHINRGIDAGRCQKHTPHWGTAAAATSN